MIKQKLEYNEDMDDLNKIKNDIKHNKQETIQNHPRIITKRYEQQKTYQQC